MATAYVPITGLPQTFDISAKIKSIFVNTGWQDGFIIFDYKSDLDFKYAGMFTGQNQWVIGHYQGNWNNRLAQVDWDDTGRKINSNQFYDVRVRLDGNKATLFANGELITSATFAVNVNQGPVGLAADRAFNWFDDFKVESLPMLDSVYETFDDELVQDLTTPDPSVWELVDRNRVGTQIGYSADSTTTGKMAFQLTDPLYVLPDAYSLYVKMRVYAQAGAWQDGFLIFDYKNDNDFKYAGAFSGQNQWVIGHYQGNWGNKLAIVDWDDEGKSINVDDYYDLQLKIDGNNARLIVDGSFVVSANFPVPIGSGQVGFGAYNAHTDFDDFEVLDAEAAYLKQMQEIADAMQELRFRYADSFEYPALLGSKLRDENNEFYLSWRVYLLPFLGFQELYDQFKRDEPWDSPNNIALIDQMPEIFRSIGHGANTTSFHVISGEGGLFSKRPPRIDYIKDGLSNTILFLEGGADTNTVWTNPAKLQFEADDPFSIFAGAVPDIFRMGMVDGHVLQFKHGLTPEQFGAMVTYDSSDSVEALTLNRKDRELEGETVYSNQLALENLKNIGVGVHKFHNIWSNLPLWPFHSVAQRDYFDENGVPYLSWRVHILPFLGYQNLYEQFHLDEPWDTPHNLSLLDQMPEIFWTNQSEPYMTDIHSIRTENEPEGINRLSSLHTLEQRRDGIDNTIMLIQAGSATAEYWTKPTSLLFDPADPFSLFNGDIPSRFNLVMCNGDAFSVTPEIGAETFAALITQDGKEVVDAGKIRRLEEVKFDDYVPPDVNEKEIQLKDKLFSIGLGLNGYHNSYGKLPPASNDTSYFDENGYPLLSWRVHILPHIGFKSLYEQFHLNEAWDSPHNLSLIPYMPDLYWTEDVEGEGRTEIRILIGDDAPYRFMYGRLIIPSLKYSFPDGTYDTILAQTVGNEAATIWTKPDFLPFDINNPFAHFGSTVPEKFTLLTAYGRARTVSSQIAPSDYAAMVTSTGGENIDVDAIFAQENDYIQ
ncbi:MAG: DUF1559 domain-containing protein [Planctomycetaceae bacterium]